VSWPDFYDEMLLQFGLDELDDPMATLANPKQTGTVSEYHNAFIKLAHLVDESEKNLISLFLFGLKEDLRGKVKMNIPLSMVAAYRSACARESIALIEKRLSMFQPFRSSGSLTMQTPTPTKNLTSTTTDKGGGPQSQVPIKGLSPAKVEEYRRKNLCFKCDEPFAYSYKCKNKSLILIELRMGDNL